MTPLVSIALPVYNGSGTIAPVIESVLRQDHENLELVITDNASTDSTQTVCRDYAATDRRVVYRRQPTNVGLLNNFRDAAQFSRGRFVRWLGDDDSLEPDYVSRCLQRFAEDDRLALVTTRIAYTDAAGEEVEPADYHPVALASTDPVERFAEVLHLMTGGFGRLDPLYGMIRRELAVLPRRNILREDEVYAARLALAGPWGHVPAVLAHRHWSETTGSELVRLLGVPAWHRYTMDLLQCRELFSWLARSGLTPDERRRAQVEVARLYARRHRNRARRGSAKLGRAVTRLPAAAPTNLR